MADDYTRPLSGMGRDQPPQVNAAPLWTGGLATALVAALVALVGVVVARGIFGIPVLGPSRYGTFGDVNTTWLCAAAALAAILATGLMHALLLTTPRPRAFFGWIVGLVTVAAALQPFTVATSLESQVATCVINLVIGLCVGTLVAAVAASTPHRER